MDRGRFRQQNHQAGGIERVDIGNAHRDHTGVKFFGSLCCIVNRGLHLRCGGSEVKVLGQSNADFAHGRWRGSAPLGC